MEQNNHVNSNLAQPTSNLPSVRDAQIGKVPAATCEIHRDSFRFFTPRRWYGNLIKLSRQIGYERCSFEVIDSVCFSFWACHEGYLIKRSGKRHLPSAYTSHWTKNSCPLGNRIGLAGLYCCNYFSVIIMAFIATPIAGGVRLVKLCELDSCPDDSYAR